MLITIVACVILIGLDQVCKMLAVQYLAPVGTMPVVPGIVEFRYIENDGAAFGILSNMQGLLIAVTGLALLAVAYVLFFKKPAGKLEYSALILIFSGGVGNLIDRIANGYVVDYINLLFIRFAVFNFADILVCVGFGLLVIAVLRAEWKNRQKAQAEKAADSSEQMPNGQD